MNIFARIECLSDFTFEIVKYYTIKYYEADIDEFRDFLFRHEDNHEYEEDFNNLIYWLEYIGKNEGAKEKFFRNESSNSEASALPPPKSIMEAHELEVKDIRLYCLRLNDNVVFLFNGGIKTTKYAQDCPNVSKYFKQANLIANKLDQLIREKEIKWNYDWTDIEYDTELKIEL